MQGFRLSDIECRVSIGGSRIDAWRSIKTDDPLTQKLYSVLVCVSRTAFSQSHNTAQISKLERRS
jgi:hypothetical protein